VSYLNGDAVARLHALMMIGEGEREALGVMVVVAAWYSPDSVLMMCLTPNVIRVSHDSGEKTSKIGHK